MPMRINPWSFCFGMALLTVPVAACAEEHRILMLNAAVGAAGHTNVFAPDVLYVAPGDTVTFVPTDAGHNAASKKGMIPQGAQPWNSPMNQEFSITLTVPGLYGYLCLPHYEMGMVGVIVVGDAHPDMEAARKLRHPEAARGAFRKLLHRVDKGPP